MPSFNAFLLLFGLFLFAIGLPATTQAYVGPGAGLSLIGSLIGLGIAIISAMLAVLLWPIRNWLRRRKAISRQ